MSYGHWVKARGIELGLRVASPRVKVKILIRVHANDLL